MKSAVFNAKQSQLFHWWISWSVRGKKGIRQTVLCRFVSHSALFNWVKILCCWKKLQKVIIVFKYSGSFDYIPHYCLCLLLTSSSLHKHCFVCACPRWCMWALLAVGQEVVIPKSDKMGSVPTQWTQTHSGVHWDHCRHTQTHTYTHDIHPLTGSVNNGDTHMFRHLLFLWALSVSLYIPKD